MTTPNWSLTSAGYELGGAPRWFIFLAKATLGFAAALVLSLAEVALTGHVHLPHVAFLVLLGQAALKVWGYVHEGAAEGWVLDRTAPLDWLCDAGLVTGLGFVPLVWLRTDAATAGRWAVVSLIVVACTYGWSRE